MLSIKIANVVPLSNMQLLVFFENGVIKKFDVKPIIKDYPEFEALNEPALFQMVKVEPGGYGVSWNEDLDCSEGEIWKNGVEIPLSYPACFYPCEEQEGYTVVVPDLPGCVTQGKSLIDAIGMAVDAASGWVLDEMEDGKPIPPASKIEDVQADERPGGFVKLIELDADVLRPAE